MSQPFPTERLVALGLPQDFIDAQQNAYAQLSPTAQDAQTNAWAQLSDADLLAQLTNNQPIPRMSGALAIRPTPSQYGEGFWLSTDQPPAPGRLDYSTGTAWLNGV